MHRAAVLTGAAQALRERIGAPDPAPDLARYSKTRGAAEQALGSTVFTAALDAGRARPVAEAVRFAMGE
jgi:hypothetical protein